MLSLLFVARFGVPHSEKMKLELLCNDLVIYNLSLVEDGQKPGITPQGIKRWFGGADGLRPPTKQNAKRFLYRYLRSIEDLVKEGEAKQAYDDLALELSPYAPAPEQRPAQQQAVGATPSNGAVVALDGRTPAGAIIARFLSQVPPWGRNEHHDLYGDTASPNENDSYYIMYRFSTNNGSVLKTFLEVSNSVIDGKRIYTFKHSIWSSNDPKFSSNVFHECDGVIGRFEKSYYFAGLNYKIHINRHEDSDRYDKEKDSHKTLANGVGIITVEHSSIDRNHDLIAALTMTLADETQPVIARAAILRLGTKSRLKLALDGKLVEPTELDRDKISEDLKRLINRLKEKGINEGSLPAYLRGQLKDKQHWNSRGAKDLEKRIIEMIANLPAWKDKAPKATLGFGALESWGPMNRPRE
jgi:hypothetical protein